MVEQPIKNQLNKDIKNYLNFLREVLMLMGKPLRDVKNNYYGDSPLNRLRLICLSLFYKAFLLSCNIEYLLKDSQFQTSAYLVRGLIETWADMKYLIDKNDEKILDKFWRSAVEVYNSQINIEKKGYTKIHGKWTDETISSRIRNLNAEPVEWAYEYLNYFCHSSSVGLWNSVILKWEKHCIREQIFTTIHISLEITELYFTLMDQKDIDFYQIRKKFINIRRNS